MGLRRIGLNRAECDTRRQNFSSAACAPSGSFLFIAVDQHHGVHRARRGARDAVDPQPWFLEEPIEHAPREGAVRAATLQGKIDQNGLAVGAGGLTGRGGFHCTLLWTVTRTET